MYLKSTIQPLKIILENIWSRMGGKQVTKQYNLNSIRNIYIYMYHISSTPKIYIFHVLKLQYNLQLIYIVSVIVFSPKTITVTKLVEVISGSRITDNNLLCVLLYFSNFLLEHMYIAFVVIKQCSFLKSTSHWYNVIKDTYFYSL